jgi:hypothetical protein
MYACWVATWRPPEQQCQLLPEDLSSRRQLLFHRSCSTLTPRLFSIALQHDCIHVTWLQAALMYVVCLLRSCAAHETNSHTHTT